MFYVGWVLRLFFGAFSMTWYDYKDVRGVGWGYRIFLMYFLFRFLGTGSIIWEGRVLEVV